MPLPTDAKERKLLQLYTFMFEYFPDAWLEVVRVARVGNEQHNKGEPLHWARDKSTDQMNAAFNHIFDYGLGSKIDVDQVPHLAKAIWRLMAQLQLDLEATRADNSHAAVSGQQATRVVPSAGSIYEHGATLLHVMSAPLCAPSGPPGNDPR